MVKNIQMAKMIVNTPLRSYYSCKILSSSQEQRRSGMKSSLSTSGVKTTLLLAGGEKNVRDIPHTRRPKTPQNSRSPDNTPPPRGCHREADKFGQTGTPNSFGSGSFGRPRTPVNSPKQNWVIHIQVRSAVGPQPSGNLPPPPLLPSFRQLPKDDNCTEEERHWH